MQIVIDIPEELYKANHRGLEAEELWNLRIAIKNGTPLPKGHGRLKDVDAIIDTLGCEDRYIYVKACLEEDAPTIIEADRESEEV